MNNAHLARNYIKFVAAVLLIAAGAIHSFPVLWKAWEAQMLATPSLHHLIGAIGFSVGILNLLVLTYEVKQILKKRKK
jgi:hypothetical protein